MWGGHKEEGGQLQDHLFKQSTNDTLEFICSSSLPLAQILDNCVGNNYSSWLVRTHFQAPCMQFEKVHLHSRCIHSPFLLLFTTKPYKLAPTYVHAQKYTLQGVLCVQRWQPRTSATCQKWPLKWCELFTLAFTFHQDMHYKQSG